MIGVRRGCGDPVKRGRGVCTGSGVKMREGGTPGAPMGYGDIVSIK